MLRETIKELLEFSSLFCEGTRGSMTLSARTCKTPPSTAGFTRLVFPPSSAALDAGNEQVFVFDHFSDTREGMAECLRAETTANPLHRRFGGCEQRMQKQGHFP